MALRLKHYFAFIVIALQLSVLNSGCSWQGQVSFPDLAALREKLIAEYGHQDISVAIQNQNVLGISLINSSFNELGEMAQQNKAQEIAVFVVNHYPSINEVNMVWVSFVRRKAYAFVFNYDEWRTYNFNKSFLADANALKPHEEATKARANYTESQNMTTVLVNNLQLYGDLNKGLILIPSFTIRGKKIVPPRLVDLEFASYDERKLFADNRNISIVVDNKTVVAGNARLVSTGKTAEGYVSEFLMHQITYEQFLEIVNGQDVKLKLGPKAMRLTEEQLRLLREMKECVDASKCE